jgi:epoxyqueuosine reductase
METIERRIEAKALELGYERCGIIPIGELEEYDRRLEERLQKVPESAAFYNRLNLTKIGDRYPWAKSVVVAVSRYGLYKVPEFLKGVVAKHYLFDARSEPRSAEYQAHFAMEDYLKSLGLKTASERIFGIVGLRNAAMKAGLGVVRNNNFFYTESGSWVNLVTWLTDRDISLIHKPALPPCPDGCLRCVAACPTGSLSAHHTLSPLDCVCYMTANSSTELDKTPLSSRFECLYGCDICQEACPMNTGKWEDAEDFPGVSELAAFLTPVAVMELDEAYYRQHIQPKFFYLKPTELWKWKVNALNYMRNNYQDAYRPHITSACDDGSEKVRAMARLICSELGL